MPKGIFYLYNKNMKTNLKKILLISGGIVGVCSLTASIAATVIIIQNQNKNPNIDTTIQYKTASNDYEEYINNNSLSLLFLIQQNDLYINQLLNNLNKNPNNQEYNNLISFMQTNNRSNYNITSGTTWLFDYKENTLFNTYYFATNIHVLNLGYTIEYNINNTDSIDFFIPYSDESSNSFSVYMTQPNGQPNTNEYKNFKNIVSNTQQSLNYNWINLTDYYKGVLPIGVMYNDDYVNNNNPYIGKITYTSNSNSIDLYIDDKYNISTSVEYNSNNSANDFGLIEFELNPYIFNTNYSHNSQYILNRLKNIFTIPSTISENNKSRSYIQRIKYLNSLLENYEENKKEIINNFLFTSFTEDLNSTYSVAGYPGISSASNSYTTFNCSTIDANKIIPNEILNARVDIQLWYNHQNYYYKYDSINNYCFPGVNLGHGSSGSMVINQNYQIVGIYWGVIEGNNLLLGMVTPMYDLSDKNSLVFRYLQYLNEKQDFTELYNLFKNLNSNNFFN